MRHTGILLLALSALTIGGSWLLSRKKAEKREEKRNREADETREVDPETIAFLDAVEPTVGPNNSVIWPYLWGGGGPGKLDAGEEGVDCSGYVTNILARIGWVDGRERITADWVMLHGTKVPKGQQRPGDVWAYKITHPDGSVHRHEELVYSFPDAVGEVTLVGASGAGVHFKRSKGFMLDGFKGYYRIKTDQANV